MAEDRRSSPAGVPSRVPPDRKLTYEEFLDWCDEDTWAEWVNGDVVFLPPVSVQHQELVGFLACVLGLFVEERELGKVIMVPFQMKTGPHLGGRFPDLLFVAREHLGRLKEFFLDGPADLVVEIASAETRLRDRGEKFAEYEEGGVREYWVIDLERRVADFYVLDPRGRFRLADIDAEGWYTSSVLQGFRLKVGWLWADPLPKVADALRELGLAVP